MAKSKKEIELNKLLELKRPIKWGYVRVSTKEQSEKRQVKELKEYGVDFIMEEKASGKNFQDRGIYNKLIGLCKTGDVIVCTALDRFSRNNLETFKELENLKEKGIRVIFLKENVDTTHNIASSLILSIFSSLAEIERERLLERQKEGYEALERTADGKLISKKGTIIGGKVKKLTQQQENLLKDYKNGKSIYNLTQLAKIVNLSRPTLYKKLKEI